MYMPDPATVRILHQDRLRDAAKRRLELQLIREADEQTPTLIQGGLLQQIKHLMHVGKRVQPQPQDCNDVRPAHAI
jgi:hypothetical protein